MKVQGKTIVVTGAGNGMGREMVFELLKRGASVAAVDLNEHFLEETRQKISEKHRNRFSSHCVDITDLHAVESLPALVISAHGQVDGLINNAGIIQPFVRVNDVDYATVDKVMKVNFFGSLYMVKTFLPYLLNRPEAHIANVSSMGGFLPVPGQSIYGASKAAVKLMTEGLQSELSSSVVGVSIIFPGAVGTNITANSGVHMQLGKAAEEMAKKYKALSPDKAASIMIDGIEKNRSRIYVGKDARLMNILYRISPGYASRLITRNMKQLLGDQ
jgi:short-subunit dehydrogenase